MTSHEEGGSERRIGVSKTAVPNNIYYLPNYVTNADMGRSGCQRKTSDRDDCMMRRMATRSPSCSSKITRAALPAKGTNVNLMTVSRHLSNELGLKSHKPARKPRKTTAMELSHGASDVHASGTGQLQTIPQVAGKRLSRGKSTRKVKITMESNELVEGEDHLLGPSCRRYDWQVWLNGLWKLS